jgi:hypothetical protein
MNQSLTPRGSIIISKKLGIRYAAPLLAATRLQARPSGRDMIA